MPTSLPPPKRNLSAYNLFFQCERKRILEGRSGKGVPLSFEEVRRVTLEHKLRGKRKHKKTHGKVSFRDMAQRIAVQWRLLDDKSKRALDAQAAIEKQEYQKKVAEWKAAAGIVLDDENSHKTNDVTAAARSAEVQVVHPVMITASSSRKKVVVQDEQQEEQPSSSAARPESAGGVIVAGSSSSSKASFPLIQHIGCSAPFPLVLEEKSNTTPAAAAGSRGAGDGRGNEDALLLWWAAAEEEEGAAAASAAETTTRGATTKTTTAPQQLFSFVAASAPTRRTTCSTLTSWGYPQQHTCTVAPAPAGGAPQYIVPATGAAGASPASRMGTAPQEEEEKEEGEEQEQEQDLLLRNSSSTLLNEQPKGGEEEREEEQEGDGWWFSSTSILLRDSSLAALNQIISPQELDAMFEDEEEDQMIY